MFCLISAAVVSLSQRSQREIDLVAPTPTPVGYPSLADLQVQDAATLAQQDIALLNLGCADALPGAEPIDIAACLRTLDQWAERVRSETYRHGSRFTANPEHYNNSAAYFRMLMLVTVLQEDFGVHYDSELIYKVDFTNRDSLFINGMLSGKGGTCVSMPVLYTAVARRLGYPVFLVNAKGHMFCRWDGAGERLNIEGAGRGLNVYDDDHYRQWPHPIRQSEIDRGVFLKSLNMAESFAAFLAARGHYLEDINRKSLACDSYRAAIALAPDQPMYQAFLHHASRSLKLEHAAELRRHQIAMREKQRRQMFADPVTEVRQPGFNPLVSDPFLGVPPSHTFAR